MQLVKYKVMRLQGESVENYKYGETVEMSFDDFEKLSPIETYDKHKNVGFVLGHLEPAVRLNNNVQYRVWIPVDIDGADKDIFEDLVAAIHTEELDAIIHTSWSHDPVNKKYKYRIIFNTAGTIEVEDYPHAYDNLINSIPYLKYCQNKGWIDDSMKKLSQFIYAPCYHPLRKDYYHHVRTGGVSLEPDTRNFKQPNNNSSGLHHVSEYASFKAFEDVIPEGSRNDKLTKICGSLVAKFKNKIRVATELHGLNQVICKPPLDVGEVNSIIESIWTSHFKNNPTDVPVTDKPKSKLVLMSVKDMMNLPDMEWLVDGLIVKMSINMIFGRSGDTKSFVGLHMGMCLATARQFFGIGSDVEEPIDVVFNALEGAYGLKNRVDGWLQFYNQTDVPNFHITSYNPVLNDEKLVDEFIEGLRAYNLKTPLIIIDTYNQATPDLNENDAGATGTVMKNCQRIIAELNATLIIIHHSNKGENGEYRGSTALKASMDSMIKVELNNNQKMYAKWTVDKVKDGEHGVVYDYQLHKQDLGYTSKGKAKNTLVVKELGLSKAKGDRQKLGKRQLLVWSLITEYLKPNLNLSDDAMMVKEYCVARMGGIEQHRRGNEYDNQLKSFIVKKMVRVYPNSSGIEQIQIIES